MFARISPSTGLWLDKSFMRQRLINFTIYCCLLWKCCSDVHSPYVSYVKDCEGLWVNGQKSKGTRRQHHQRTGVTLTQSLRLRKQLIEGRRQVAGADIDHAKDKSNRCFLWHFGRISLSAVLPICSNQQEQLQVDQLSKSGRTGLLCCSFFIAKQRDSPLHQNAVMS